MNLFIKNYSQIWSCHPKKVGPNQAFHWDESNGQFSQEVSKKGQTQRRCLTAQGDKIFLLECLEGNEEQSWSFKVTARLHKVWGQIISRKTGACLTHFPSGRNTSNLKTVVLR